MHYPTSQQIVIISIKWLDFIHQAALPKYVSTDIAYRKVNVFNTSCSHHANSRNMFSIHVDNQFVGNSYNLPQTINCCIRFCPSQLVSSRESNNDQMLPYNCLRNSEHLISHFFHFPPSRCAVLHTVAQRTHILLYQAVSAEPHSGKFQEYLTSLETLCFIHLARKP